jgi:hypothetical protein
MVFDTQSATTPATDAQSSLAAADDLGSTLFPGITHLRRK